MSVSAIPLGFNTVSAYLVVPNAVQALEFYGRAFAAETVMRMPGPNGQGTMHAEMRIGNSMVLLTDENPMWELKSPASLGATPVSLHVYVEDADAVFTRAIKAGCTAKFPMSDAFWGDRYGKLTDPYGHVWGIATHVEDVPPDEMAARAAAAFAAMTPDAA